MLVSTSLERICARPWGRLELERARGRPVLTEYLLPGICELIPEENGRWEYGGHVHRRHTGETGWVKMGPDSTGPRVPG